VIAGIVLILAAALGSYLVFYQSRSPETVVRKFIEADQKGDFASESLYVSSGLDSRMILSLMQTVRTQSGTSPFQNYKILRSSIQNDRATVHVQITFNPPPATPIAAPRTPPAGVTTYDVMFFLTRQSGDWRIEPTETVAGLTGVLLAAGLQQSPLNLLFNGNLGAGTFPLPLPNGTTPGFPGIPAPPTSVPPSNPGSGFL